MYIHTGIWRTVTVLGRKREWAENESWSIVFTRWNYENGEQQRWESENKQRRQKQRSTCMYCILSFPLLCTVPDVINCFTVFPLMAVCPVREVHVLYSECTWCTIQYYILYSFTYKCTRNSHITMIKVESSTLKNSLTTTLLKSSSIIVWILNKVRYCIGMWYSKK